VWKPSDSRWRTIEVDSENGRIGEVRIAQDHPDWLHLHVTQVLVSTEEVYTPGTDQNVTQAPRENRQVEPGGGSEIEERRQAELDTPERHSGFLTPTPEETEDDDSEYLSSYLKHDDPMMDAHLAQETERWSHCLVPVEELHPPIPTGVPLSYLLDSSHSQENIPPKVVTALILPQNECTLEYGPEAAYLLESPLRLTREQVVVFKTDALGTRREVTKRDDDLLTP